MSPKPGLKTTEFWIVLIVQLAGAVVAILAARGLMNPEEGELWVDLVAALAAIIAPIVMALTAKAYTNARTELKKNGQE